MDEDFLEHRHFFCRDFDAEVTAIGALYDRGRIQQAWDRLETLERQVRLALPADVSARFYLLRGRMWFARDRGELARKNFAEVVRQADRPGAGPEAGDAAARALAMWARELETDQPDQARERLEEALRRVDCTLASLAVVSPEPIGPASAAGSGPGHHPGGERVERACALVRWRGRVDAGEAGERPDGGA